MVPCKINVKHYQTTSLPLSMKKKTSAGAQRSKGSPTIICEYAANIISRTSPILAVFLILSETKIHRFLLA